MNLTLPNSLEATGRGLPARRTPLAAAQSPGTASIASSLARVLRPQAAYRWLMPYIGNITPQYIEMTLRGALAGNHVQAWELFDLMLDTWPELASCTQELTESVQRRKLIIEADADEDAPPSEDAEQRRKVCVAALRRMRPDPCADENDLNGTVGDLMAGWYQGQVVLEVNYDAEFGSDELNLIQHPTLGDITAPRSTFWVHPVCYAWSMEGRLGLRVELGALRNASKTAMANTPGSVFNMPTARPMPGVIDEFPPEKFLIGIHKAKAGTALGGALLRPLAWWWCASNFSADWLLNLSQLFGIPFRWVNYDPSLPDELKSELDSMMQNMGSSGWARFPTGTEVKFLEAGKGSGASPQDALLDRCDRYARLLILGQTMSGGTDSSKGGGKAFGSVEEGVKEKRVDAACKYVAGIFNSQLFPSLCRLNFGEAGEVPHCHFMTESEGDVSDAQRDATLATMGLTLGESFLRKKYNVPKPQDDETVIGGRADGGGQKAEVSGEPGDDDAGESETETETETEKPTPPPLSAAAADPAIGNRQSAIGNPDLGSVLHELLLPLLKRLDAISKIEDATIQQHLIEKLLRDFPAIAEAIHADDSLAKKLSPVLATALVDGLKQTPATLAAKSGALECGDLPGHEFRGNQWTEGTGGAETQSVERLSKAGQKLTIHTGYTESGVYIRSSIAGAPDGKLPQLNRNLPDQAKRLGFTGAVGKVLLNKDEDAQVSRHLEEAKQRWDASPHKAAWVKRISDEHAATTRRLAEYDELRRRARVGQVAENDQAKLQ